MANRQQVISEAKKRMSRASMTPFVIELKWVRKLNERIETIFMMPKDTYTFLSSRIVKEIARLGGDVNAFVPAQVQTALAKKFPRAKKI